MTYRQKAVSCISEGNLKAVRPAGRAAEKGVGATREGGGDGLHRVPDD